MLLEPKQDLKSKCSHFFMLYNAFWGPKVRTWELSRVQEPPRLLFPSFIQRIKVDIILFSQHTFSKTVNTKVRYRVQRAGWLCRPSVWTVLCMIIVDPQLSWASCPQTDPSLPCQVKTMGAALLCSSEHTRSSRICLGAGREREGKSIACAVRREP